MLAILFPHMYEDVEYLLPDQADSEDAELRLALDESSHGRSSTQGANGFGGGSGSGDAHFVNGNAVAGPSRLR